MEEDTFRPGFLFVEPWDPNLKRQYCREVIFGLIQPPRPICPSQLEWRDRCPEMYFQQQITCANDATET